MSVVETAEQLLDRVLARHLPIPRVLSIDAWADEHRELSSTSSAEPGRWRTDRTPYMRQILEDLSEYSGHEEIVLDFGTQLGKSEAGLNWTGCNMDQSPGPMMIVQPTIDLAKRYSRQRVASMIRSTPVLRDLVRDARSRDSGNTTLIKEFPGGVLAIVGANSASGLASMPVRYLHLDEVDDYPLDVDDQGPPSKIVEARMDSFGRRRKKLVTSSPKMPKGTSTIETLYELGTMFQYHVPCPHCHHYQVLNWAVENSGPGLRYWRDDPESTAYVCAKCGAEIQEHHKTAMLRGGAWVARNPGAKIRSYHLSSLYSPIGWASWSKIVKEYLEALQEKARGDSGPLKAWHNMRLAQTVKEDSEQLDKNWLLQRADARPLRIVPDACLVLTGGVDVQGNRIELAVWAWGPGEICAIVDYIVIYGDPAQLDRISPDQLTVWERLDAALEERYLHSSGNTLAVDAIAIDTGGSCTHAVYTYCRDKALVRVRKDGREWVRKTLAIKGNGKPGLPIKAKGSPVDINWRGKLVRHGVRLWTVGVHTSKDWWQGRLKIQQPGPGYVYLSNELPDDWFEQMSAEQRVSVRTAGGLVKRWVLPDGKRNEAWDTAQYALFAAIVMDVNRFTSAMWQRLRDQVCPLQGDLLSPQVIAAPAPPQPAPAVPRVSVQTSAPVPARPPAPAAKSTFVAPRAVDQED